MRWVLLFGLMSGCVAKPLVYVPGVTQSQTKNLRYGLSAAEVRRELGDPEETMGIPCPEWAAARLCQGWFYDGGRHQELMLAMVSDGAGMLRLETWGWRRK